MKHRFKSIGRLFLATSATFLLFGGQVSALSIPPPPKDTAILDQANVIEAEAETRISQKLIDYKAKTGNEIAVLTIPSLDGEDSFDFSHKVASSWGIGSKEANNGALLFVALKERKIFIQVGRGLEPSLTDIQTRIIVTEKIAPEFKKGNYAGGIESGVDNMMKVIGGEKLSEPSNQKKAGNFLSSIGGLLPFFFFPLVYLASFLARSKSWWLGGVLGAIPGVIAAFSISLLIAGIITVGGILLGLLLDFLLSKNYQERVRDGDRTSWWGSGGGFFGGTGGSSGGSGGFGGFGGGSFGGGGGGGDW